MTTTDVTTTSLLPVLLDHISYSRDAEDVCYDDDNIKVFCSLFVGTTRTLCAAESVQLSGIYTLGEMTSENLWSRYARHFVGITWRNVWR